nr:Chain B, THR-ALA-GLU-HIS-ASP-GLU-LEU [Homo sapiens]
TAEHDEL